MEQNLNLINTTYCNNIDKEFTYEFMYNTNIKKYILGVNKFTKSILNHLEVDGIIDDFTRVQNSKKKKNILNINDVSNDALILVTSMGSPLEVQTYLDKLHYKNFHYFGFYKYCDFILAKPPFICDFEDDYKANNKQYLQTYNLLEDNKSQEVFTKIINFKISFDISFLKGFTNNFEEQYFDNEILPDFDDLVFIDGGTYVGDTLPSIIKNYPSYKKIYCIEPNELHINIAKRNFEDFDNIEFINCGLGDKKINHKDINLSIQNNCQHDYQALNIDTIDNLIRQKVDFVKLDIEGAEQSAILGAKEIIEKYHPVLAICIYHKAEDWYKVPLSVLSIRDDYKIYIRHYMEGIYETVMYFIPK
jgi:FkbM family methyltransferase